MKNGRNRVNGLLEEIEAEMNANWAEAHEDDYATRRQDEDELLERHPLLVNAADATLIEIIGMSREGAEDGVDEVMATAAIVLERRLSASAA